MAIFKPYRVQSSQLNSLPKVEGQFIIVEDTQEMYFDKSASQRIAVGGLTDVDISFTNGTLTLTDQNGNTLSTASIPRVIEAVSWNDEELPDTASLDTYSKPALDAMFQSIDTSLDNVTLTQSNSDGHILTFTNADGNTTTITIPDNNSVTGVKGNSESTYRTGNVNITKANIGLGNVENKTSATIRGEITSANITTALGYTPLNNALKGANSGLAELDANGKVPSSQLPSFVDDVLEYSSQSNFPSTGETGKIYIDIATNKTYRWSGSTYTVIGSDLTLGTTSSTAFRGDYGAAAYAHGVTNKGNQYAQGLYKITTNAEGHVIAAEAVTKSDITALGIPAQDTTYSTGNTSTAGITKLYTATGSNTDGAMTQKAVTDLIGDINTLMAAL